MEAGLQLAQHAATVCLNLAIAVAAGACLSSLWMAHGRLRMAALGSTVAALLASAMLLWLEAAVAAEVPLGQAGSAVYSMLTATHYGIAWEIGAAALVAASIFLGSGPADLTPGLSRVSLLALAAFLYSRSMVSHAAADGDISVAILADWIHLMAITAWVGEVIVAGLLTLPKAVARYAHSLSSSATVALAGVVATGLFSAWRNVGAVANLTGNPYGSLLLVKLVFVGAAIALGGFNRFFVLPTIQEPASARRFVLVLRIEAVVLAVVLVLAALLSSTSPPTAV